MTTINTLSQFADYLNDYDGWPLNAETIIDTNGWINTYMCGSDEICSDGITRLVITEDGIKEYPCEGFAKMRITSLDDYMDAIVSYGAEPFIVDDEELARELCIYTFDYVDEVEGKEYLEAISLLGVENCTPQHIYRFRMMGKTNGYICLNKDL